MKKPKSEMEKWEEQEHIYDLILSAANVEEDVKYTRKKRINLWDSLNVVVGGEVNAEKIDEMLIEGKVLHVYDDGDARLATRKIGYKDNAMLDKEAIEILKDNIPKNFLSSYRIRLAGRYLFFGAAGFYLYSTLDESISILLPFVLPAVAQSIYVSFEMWWNRPEIRRDIERLENNISEDAEVRVNLEMKKIDNIQNFGMRGVFRFNPIEFYKKEKYRLNKIKVKYLNEHGRYVNAEKLEEEMFKKYGKLIEKEFLNEVIETKSNLGKRGEILNILGKYSDRFDRFDFLYNSAEGLMEANIKEAYKISSELLNSNPYNEKAKRIHAKILERLGETEKAKTLKEVKF